VGAVGGRVRAAGNGELAHEAAADAGEGGKAEGLVLGGGGVLGLAYGAAVIPREGERGGGVRSG
jgi:hypothetical protein